MAVVPLRGPFGAEMPVVTASSAVSRVDIETLLPHRDPLLLVSRVVSYDQEELVAEYQVPDNPFWAAGHFPGNPMMVGFLIAESLAQMFGLFILLNQSEEQRLAGVPLLTSADKLKFRSPVRPGDLIVGKVSCLGQCKGFYKGQGEARVAGVVVWKGVFTGTTGTLVPE